MRANKQEGGMNKGHKAGLIDDLCRGVWRYARSVGAGPCVRPAEGELCVKIQGLTPHHPH